MANGTAAIALLPLPEIPAAPQPFDERFGGAEGWVDAIIIELADVAMNAPREIEAGGLDPNTRLKGGDLLSRLVVLRGKIGEREFAAAVHRTGRTRRGVPLSMAVKDDVIEIVAEVARELRDMN